uniref:Uncharacterized protein n=1 Tax=Ditylenchus dipsaci TaxID=166011 RepID=A0A915DPT3_9BILA
MDWSLMSTTSSNTSNNPLMDHSFISSTSSSGLLHGYGDMTDLMMNSNTTYIVENRLDEDDEDEEIHQRINGMPENLLGQSVIMDGPTLDSAAFGLPIIGDSSEEDEELSTPMVEIIKDIWNGSSPQDVLKPQPRAG